MAKESLGTFMMREHEERAVRESRAELFRRSEKKELSVSEQMAIEESEKRRKKAKAAEFFASIEPSLIKECLMSIVTPSLRKSYVDQHRRNLLAESLVTDYIKENPDLLRRMSRASNLMSEYALLIEKTTEKVKERSSADNDETWEIDSRDRKDFFDTINGIDPSDVTFTVQARVSNTTDSFVTDTLAAKEEIKEVLNHTKHLADSKQDAKVKESVLSQGKKKIDAIESKPRSLFDCMVKAMAGSAYSDQDIREVYVDGSGNLNMEKVVDDCETIYTVMEVFNTAGLIPDSAALMEKTISSLRS
jgi:hypothetical protein